MDARRTLHPRHGDAGWWNPGTCGASGSGTSGSIVTVIPLRRPTQVLSQNDKPWSLDVPKKKLKCVYESSTRFMETNFSRPLI